MNERIRKGDNGLDHQRVQKRLKTAGGTSGNADDNNNQNRANAPVPTGVVVSPLDNGGRPMSKKELRAAKKAAQKKSIAVNDSNDALSSAPMTPEEARAENIRLKKEERKQYLKEQQLILAKELRKEKKLRQQKKLRREMNAPGGSKAVQAKKDAKASMVKKDDAAKPRDDRDLDIFHKVFHGSTDDATGMTTLRLGVQYMDLVVGTGVPLQDKMAVTVKYRLTGGKFGTVLDSSNKFSFRLGKGEVIQGWDIGLQGMRVGGKRKLIVPPKAGYGSQDIGAGAGAMLYFDITLLSCN